MCIGVLPLFDFYNYTRKHVSLSNMTPGDVHEKQTPYQQLSYFINKEKRVHNGIEKRKTRTFTVVVIIYLIIVSV
jgi:hypothetical protein